MAAIPPLSVAMPVHNAAPFLDEAVASILAQSFGEFEFVILDDGSTDGSLQRLRDWTRRDRRIRLVEGAQCSGPVESSNRIVRETRAPLVARMDADDRAHPDRLKLQLEALAADRGAVLAGSLADTIDESGRTVRPADYARLFRKSPFAPFPHPSILFRREAFDRSGGYRRHAGRWEDVDLYLRMAQFGRILVVARPLVSVRLSPASSRLSAGDDALDRSMDHMYRSLTGSPGDSEQRLLPDAFFPGAALRVWNGRRPRVLGRLLKHGALGLNRPTFRMLVWSAWADLDPRTLRFALKWLLRARNRIARRRLDGRDMVEWRPVGAPAQRRSA